MHHLNINSNHNQLIQVRIWKIRVAYVRLEAIHNYQVQLAIQDKTQLDLTMELDKKLVSLDLIDCPHNGVVVKALVLWLHPDQLSLWDHKAQTKVVLRAVMPSLVQLISNCQAHRLIHKRQTYLRVNVEAKILKTVIKRPHHLMHQTLRLITALSSSTWTRAKRLCSDSRVRMCSNPSTRWVIWLLAQTRPIYCLDIWSRPMGQTQCKLARSLQIHSRISCRLKQLVKMVTYFWARLLRSWTYGSLMAVITRITWQLSLQHLPRSSPKEAKTSNRRLWGHISKS